MVCVITDGQTDRVGQWRAPVLRETDASKDAPCRWTDAEKAALKRFVTERAAPTDAADALGRSPTSIVHHAHRLGLPLPPEWSTLIRKRKMVEERGTNRRR
jgi:hypothetical protein